MKIVSNIVTAGKKPAYKFGNMDATGKYFTVVWTALENYVTAWLATNEDAKAAAANKGAKQTADNKDAKAVATLTANYVAVSKLGRYCILSRAQNVANAQDYFSKKPTKEWLSNKLQYKLSGLLAEELDRALPREFFRIASSTGSGATASAASGGTAAAAPMSSGDDEKSSASSSGFLSDDLQPTSSELFADLDVTSMPALSEHIICRIGNRDQELRRCFVVTVPLLLKSSADEALQKQNKIWCVWIPNEIAMIYQPAKLSSTYLTFKKDETPVEPPLAMEPKQQAFHFVDKNTMVLAQVLWRPDPGQGLGQSRSDSVNEMRYLWLGPRSLGYALKFDMSLHRDPDITVSDHKAAHGNSGGVEPESWFSAFLPRSGDAKIATMMGGRRQIPRKPVTGSMDSEITYYKKADIGTLGKKNYPTTTIPFEQAFASSLVTAGSGIYQARGPMLVASTFTDWFKSRELLDVKTIKRKYVTPDFNPKPRKDAAGVMGKYIQELSRDRDVKAAFGKNFKGTANEVGTAVFDLLVSPAFGANAAAADTAAAGSAGAAASLGKRADTKGGAAGKARIGEAASPAAKYWYARSRLLRTTLGNDASPAEMGQIRTDQEWCHLIGHGDGGKEKPENFVAGSKHCNTEQLAIEEGHRITRGTLKVDVTAYLLPQQARWFREMDGRNEAFLAVLEAGKKCFKDASALLAKKPPDQTAATTLVDTFADEDMLPADNKKLRKKWAKKSIDEKLRFLMNWLETVDSLLYVYFPVAAFIRYKISYGGRKIFDHVFDAQKESFDYNEFQIVRTTVRRAVLDALRTTVSPSATTAIPIASATTAAGLPAVASGAASAAPALASYEDEINQAIRERMKEEIRDLIYREPGLETEQVKAIFDCSEDTLLNPDIKAGSDELTLLKERIDARCKVLKAKRAALTDDETTVFEKLEELRGIERYTLPSRRKSAAAVSSKDARAGHKMTDAEPAAGTAAAPASVSKTGMPGLP